MWQKKRKYYVLVEPRHNRRLVPITLMAFECFACHVTENNTTVFTVKSIWHDEQEYSYRHGKEELFNDEVHAFL